MRFQSSVSATSLRRRPSRLLSITTKKKTKTRTLILTNHRLICVKIEKGGRVLAVRGEWLIPKVILGEKPKPEKEKEKKKSKDTINQTVISVDPKGDNEFVVLTVRQALLRLINYGSPCIRQATKSLSFKAEDSALRSKWVLNIQRTLDPSAVA